MSDSSAAGYLAPNPAPAPQPLEGQDLSTFLQQVVAGVTGMPGPSILPRWQAEPPTIPSTFTAWAAVGITRRSADTFAWVQHQSVAGTNGYDELQRDELIYLLCSFYDTGSGGQADTNASLLRDGLQIEQNRAILKVNNIGLVGVEDAIILPTLIKQRWLYRVDHNVVFRRRIQRSYPVLDLLAFSTVVLNTSIPSTVPIHPHGS